MPGRRPWRGARMTLHLDRLSVDMDAKNIIRSAVNRVALLRQAAADDSGLAQAVSAVKHFQARRFAATYSDLLRAEQYRPAALFFSLQNAWPWPSEYNERWARRTGIAAGVAVINYGVVWAFTLVPPS